MNYWMVLVSQDKSAIIFSACTRSWAATHAVSMIRSTFTSFSLAPGTGS
jgi:hypothetical protein